MFSGVSRSIPSSAKYRYGGSTEGRGTFSVVKRCGVCPVFWSDHSFSPEQGLNFAAHFLMVLANNRVGSGFGLYQDAVFMAFSNRCNTYVD